MEMGIDSSKLPPPPSSRRHIATAHDFLAVLLSDLSLRLEWLGQVLDSVGEQDVSREALAKLRAHAKALGDVRTAVLHVQSHVRDRHVAALFTIDGVLAAYLSRLCAWADEVANEFEKHAVALRKLEPTMLLFSHKSVSASYAEFHELGEALRRDLAAQAPSMKTAAWQPFEAHVEEMIWAVEWLHMGLTRVAGA
jgi:hypothetical protein